MTGPPGTSRLFPDSHAPPPAGVHLANIDGASRGNPGPASYAVVLRDPAGKVVFQLCKKLGRQTNNVAEYYALLAALDYAVNHGIKGLRIRSDSELLVRQMRGHYKVKSTDLKPLHERASKLAKQLEYLILEHVPREMNREADALANLALDEGGSTGNPGEPARAGEAGPGGALRGASWGDSRPPIHPSPSRPMTIRARFVNGAIVPSEPVDLPEGGEIVVTIRKL